MEKELSPGPGYRLLEFDDTIERGDEVFVHTETWIPVNLSVGLTPRRARGERVFRRDRGNRLPVGTVIQRGDEYLDSDGVWKPTSIFGERVVDGTYRRRVSLDVPVQGNDVPLSACSGIVESELWKLEKKLRRKGKLQDITHAECYNVAAAEVLKTISALKKYSRL